eukprot:gene8098-8935_t
MKRFLLGLILCLWPKLLAHKRALNIRILKPSGGVSPGHLDGLYRIDVETSVLHYEKRFLDQHPEDTVTLYPAATIPSDSYPPPVSDRRVSVDLYSMVHVGELAYYHAIGQRLADYDLILYELITDSRNILQLSPHRKQLIHHDISSPKTEALAQQLGLASQLSSLPLTHQNCYLADLSMEVIMELEERSRWQTILRYWLTILAGRTFSQKLLEKFFLNDQSFASILRGMSWLSPCPELFCLLLDWAKMSPKAGGFSLLFIAMVDQFLAGRLLEARKLAFTQQLLGGLPDGGGFGGGAMSNTEVRIRARNQECCDVLNDFVKDFQEKNESTNARELKVAILYGAYHIDDLHIRLEDMGFQYQESNNKSRQLSDRFVAWSVSSHHADNNTIINDISRDESLWQGYEGLPITKERLTILFTSFLFYLTASAVDWWLLIKLFADAIKEVDHSSSLIFVVYVVTYWQRHLWALQQASNLGIQWDRGLFSFSEPA